MNIHNESKPGNVPMSSQDKPDEQPDPEADHKMREAAEAEQQRREREESDLVQQMMKQIAEGPEAQLTEWEELLGSLREKPLAATRWGNISIH